MPGVGAVVRVAAWDPKGPEFKPRWATELIHQEVDSACHPSEVGEVSTSVLGPVYAPVRIGVPFPCVVRGDQGCIRKGIRRKTCAKSLCGS